MPAILNWDATVQYAYYSAIRSSINVSRECFKAKNDAAFVFHFFRGLDQGRYKVLEMDTKGNLYLYKSALLCKNEIIKRLTDGNYQMAEPSIFGNTYRST